MSRGKRSCPNCQTVNAVRQKNCTNCNYAFSFKRKEGIFAKIKRGRKVKNWRQDSKVVRKNIIETDASVSIVANKEHMIVDAIDKNGGELSRVEIIWNEDNKPQIGIPSSPSRKTSVIKQLPYFHNSKPSKLQKKERKTQQERRLENSIPYKLNGQNEQAVEEKMLRKFIRQIYEGSRFVSSSLQKVHTPFWFCKKILLKLTEYTDIWNTDILVLFNIEFILVLKELGVNLDNITFMSDSEAMKGIAKNLFNVNVVNFSVSDLMTYHNEGIHNMKRQFKVIIGNPPYQGDKKRTTDSKKGACGKRLWQDFAALSLDLVKEDGFISLVHPPLWRKPEHFLFPEFKKRSLLYVEMHNVNDGLEIFGRSTAYDWYILGNFSSTNKTTIKCVTGTKKSINIEDWGFLPSSDFELIQSLLAKDDEEKCEVLYERTGCGTDKPWMSEFQTDEFKYPCFYTMPKLKEMQLWYCNTNKEGFFGIPKVIVSENGSVATYNDYKGEYGLTQFMFGIPVTSEKEAEEICKALVSKKFEQVWDAVQWMTNHREWRIFGYFRKDFYKDFV